MRSTYTEADFDQISWHDCHVHAVGFLIGDVDVEDWTADLALDIDFILEWLWQPDSSAQFLIASAYLTFHGVTDPKIMIDWGHSGFQSAIHAVSIDHIARERISDQKVHLDRPYYEWQIVMNSPQPGEIRFGAVGFTQTLRMEPVLSRRQWLSLEERYAGGQRK